jgi:hypothetical protein
MEIEERLLRAAEEMLGKSKLFSKLEKITGIKADSWKNVAHRKQRATTEMLQFAFQEWPNFVFWIATGTTPKNNQKHTTPDFYKNDFIDQNGSRILSYEPITWSIEDAKFVKDTLATYWQNADSAMYIDDTLNAFRFALKVRGKKFKIKEFIDSENTRLAKEIAKASDDDVRNAAKYELLIFEQQVVEFQRRLRKQFSLAEIRNAEKNMLEN